MNASLEQPQRADLGDGTHLAYRAIGRGAPVVFLHGSGPGASGHSNFGANASVLAKAGVRVFLPDLLGYGDSSKPTDIRYTLQTHADAIRRFCDALDIGSCVLVGNSMGGACALQFALNWPERASALLLMAPGGLGGRDEYMAMPGIQRMIQTLYGPTGLTRDGLKSLLELQLFEPSSLQEATVDERWKIAQHQPIEVFKTLRVPNLTDRLPEIQCPVVGLWGAQDQFCPPSGALTLAQGCKGSQVTLISQCGHWVMVEHPHHFNRACLALLDSLGERS